MLWVYEGQTEFWGRVLAARAGLRTTQQTLDKLALDAALVANRSGREWKTLADSTLDVLYMPGHSVAWRDWQRREDYYPEGVLLWLDVDARLRELSQNKVSIDQFAQRFLATHGSVESISTYNFQDICDTLNTLAPADWKSFLNQHLFRRFLRHRRARARRLAANQRPASTRRTHICSRTATGRLLRCTLTSYSW
jgi:predicted metalloprotease with PDZ domain